MLLGAAKYLAETRKFEGAVHFIFQPAEEALGGGRAMVEEGLFDQFPCDAVFALHNKPGLPLGHMATRPGPLLAASDSWDIRIEGRGSHAAHPHLGTDPLVIGAEIVLALQTIVSRNVDPVESAVVTVGFMFLYWVFRVSKRNELPQPFVPSSVAKRVVRVMFFTMKSANSLKTLDHDLIYLRGHRQCNSAALMIYGE